MREVKIYAGGCWYRSCQDGTCVILFVQSRVRYVGTEVEKWVLDRKVDSQPVWVGVFEPEWVEVGRVLADSEQNAAYVCYQLAAHIEAGVGVFSLKELLVWPFRFRVGFRYRIKDSHELVGVLDCEGRGSSQRWVLRNRSESFPLENEETGYLLPEKSKLSYEGLAQWIESAND